jgi:hypothetical protein
MADGDQMRADLERNSSLVAMKDLDVMTRQYMGDVVWPFVATLIDKIEEQDASIDECIEQTEDLLHAETAQEIGKPIGIGLVLCTELERRLTAQPADVKLRATIAEYRQAAKVALGTLQDIAIPDGEDDEDVPKSGPVAAGAAIDPDDDEDDEDDEEDDDE